MGDLLSEIKKEDHEIVENGIKDLGYRIEVNTHIAKADELIEDYRKQTDKSKKDTVYIAMDALNDGKITGKRLDDKELLAEINIKLGDIYHEIFDDFLEAY